MPADVTLRMRRLSGLPDVGPDDPVFTADEDSRQPSRSSCSSTPASASRRSRRSRACWARACRGSRRRSPPSSATRSCEGRQRGGRGAPIRDAGRAADAGAHAGAGGRFQRSPPRGRQARRARTGGARGRGDPRCAGARRCASPISSGSRGSAARSRCEELGAVAGRLARARGRGRRPGAAGQDDRRRGDVRQPGPGPLVGAALALVEAVEAAGAAALRAGIASGPALLRAGDYYGNSVNLASRVTGVARPGQRALHAGAVRDAARDEDFSGRSPAATGSRASRGGALYRARRLPEPAEPDGRRPSSPETAVQVDHEDERRVSRDLRRAARCAVAEARRDDQLAPAADAACPGIPCCQPLITPDSGSETGLPRPSFHEASNCLPFL